MKHNLLILLLLATSITCVAEPQQAPQNMPSNRVYDVFASSETDLDALQKRNEALVQSGASSRGLFAGLGAAIVASYSNKLIQETVNATSALIGFAVKGITALIRKNSKDREAWLKTVESHNHFHQSLQTQTYIDDFYYSPSQCGALDPLNMKFNGFGCQCFLRPETGLSDDHNEARLWEFYLKCKLREDSVGRDHIVHHSKFYVEVDQLIFDTRHTSLPNDSVKGKELKPFDFERRKDLTFRVDVKVFSSWVNEAIILTDNQQIGEFRIVACIDPADLDKNGVFVYDPIRHRGKVSVTGDSFLVPRSFTGSSQSPSWGTGQYRLEMTVYEDCAINKDYYLVPQDPKRHGGKRPQEKWDNRKWHPEWKEMQTYKNRQTVWQDAWKSVSTSYVNRDWVQELVSPLTSAVCSQEQIVLSELLHFTPAASSDTGATPSERK